LVAEALALALLAQALLLTAAAAVVLAGCFKAQIIGYLLVLTLLLLGQALEQHPGISKLDSLALTPALEVYLPLLVAVAVAES
jgi:hypothetical protein